MEVSTRERLTGALIVVLALIVVAPEMLSGRRASESGTPPAQNPEDGAPLQTYSVQLGESGTEPAVVPEAPVDAAAEINAVPLAESVPPVASTVVSGPKPVAAGERTPRVDQTAKPEAPTRPAAVAATGNWWVQVGSFSSRDNAQRAAQKLRDAGYTTSVSGTRQDGKDLYRVRAGPVVDRDAARALQARLVSAGYKNPTLVAP